MGKWTENEDLQPDAYGSLDEDNDIVDSGSDLRSSVPFPGARNYGGHFTLKKFNGDGVQKNGTHGLVMTTGTDEVGPPISSDIESATSHARLRADKASSKYLVENVQNSIALQPDTAMSDKGIAMSKANGNIHWRKNTGNVVEVRNVCKSYGHGKKKMEVLSGINMTVPAGAIYGLLGPSGCGKTTLLRLIVGRLKVKSGTIRVFGVPPGARESGVPGVKVGYMPQEIALYNEFTIRETMQYFGRVHDMSYADIQARMKFLLEFLHLPKESRFIKNLSGGQKRRVSFAVALLQQPPLLILDEPTVGVDPLLRQSIWNHLVTIAQGGHTTIIITTHYIEEARQADVVGLLRGGRLLAEAAPDTLLNRYHCGSLEDVFLKLCMSDRIQVVGDEDSSPVASKAITSGAADTRGSTATVNAGFYTSTEVLVSEDQGFPAEPKRPRSSPCRILSTNKAVAQIIKNFIRMWRNVGTMIFQFAIPSVQIIIFCLAIGHDPVNLDMAIVNDDIDTLNYGGLFLDTLDNSIINQINYTEFEPAKIAVQLNVVWGIIQIPANYSQNLLSRFYGCTEVEDDVLEGSKLKIWLDITNQQIAFSLREELVRALQQFSRNMLEKNGVNPGVAELPLEFEDPIYGLKDKRPSFTEFMAPGIILSISYFMAVGLTALSFVLERKEGLLDRSYVAGVNTVEIMLGHFITQFFVMIVQVGLSLLFMIVAFNVPCRGPAGWVILLTIVQGTCGMAYGLLISAFCDEEHSAIMFALGSFYPNLLLSGIIWPIEGMPKFLRYLSYWLPQTYPVESLRDMLSRGWGITEMPVWRGYLVTIAWLTIFLIITVIIMRIRR